MPQSRTVPLLALLTLPVLGSCESESSHAGDGDEVAIYQVAKTVVMPTGDKPVSVAIGQFDGNSGMDLAVANEGHDTVQLYLKNADGTYTLAPSIGTNGSPRSVYAVRQFKKRPGEQKDTDLAVGSASDNGKIESFYSDGGSTKGGFTRENTETISSENALKVIAGELDEDKWDDIVYKFQDGDNVRIKEFSNTGPPRGGGYRKGVGQYRDITMTNHQSIDFAYGNLNNDYIEDEQGQPDYEKPLRDFVVLSEALQSGQHRLSAFLRNEDRSFGAPVETDLGPMTQIIQPESIIIAEVTGDEYPDAIVGDVGANQVHILEGSQSGTFSYKGSHAVGNAPGAMSAGTLNSDTDSDIVVASSQDGSISILMGSGNGDFVVLPPVKVGDTPSAIAVGDLGGDSDIDDIAVTCKGSNSVTLLIN